MAEELQGLPFRAQLNALYASRQPRKFICRLVNIFGRTKDCDFYLGSSSVSRRHAVLWYSGTQMMLADLASRTGTRVNCRSVDVTALQHKDEIQIGRYRLTFNIEQDETRGEIIPAQLELGGLPAGREPLVVNSPIVICGSYPDLGLTLRSKSVSGIHCAFIPTIWGVFIRDMLSRTGTLINGKRVGLARVAHGDRIKIGKFSLSAKYVEPGSHRDQWPAVEDALARLEEIVRKRAPRSSKSPDKLMLDEAMEEPKISLKSVQKKDGEAPASGLTTHLSQMFDTPADAVSLDNEASDAGAPNENEESD